MKSKSLKQFVAIRESLLKRQAELQAELSEINSALGAGKVAAPAASAPAPAPAAPAARRRGRRAQNELSLKEAVLAATKSKPLAKQDILQAVAKLGYKFTAKDPLNSLNTLLYTAKQIKNYGGKFGPA
jgi:hypothetical protein